MFLKYLQNSHKKTYIGVFLKKRSDIGFFLCILKFLRERFYRTTRSTASGIFLSYLPFFFRNNYSWGTHLRVYFERMYNVYTEVLSYKWEKLIEKLKYWNIFSAYLWDPYQSVVKLSILLRYIIVCCRKSNCFIVLLHNIVK